MTKPTASMIAAVRAVHPSERRAAALVAERVFSDFLATLTAWDDFSPADHVEMAGDAAAAEVAFRFA
jgi:hypothetical protein